MSQAAKPTGFLGRLLARGMALGHRDFYKNTAKILGLAPDDKYLEIGFGAGLFIKKYASHAKEIAGLDYSEDMVKLARKNNEKLVKSGKATFKQGDVSTLPWSDDVFSAVAGIETFYFWPKPELSLREIIRVLAPGGRIVLEMAYNKDDGMDHAKDIAKHGLRLYSGGEMKTLLEEVGFKEFSIVYFESVGASIMGHAVPKGMVVKAIKP
jgi:SAM-dependent methyltransferase